MGIIVNKYKVKLVKESARTYNIDKTIRSPRDAANVIRSIFDTATMTQEHLMMITLDTKNKVTGAFLVSIGTLNSAVTHPRDIFQRAILLNAAAIVISHNHPSGDPTPSPEDIQLTERMVKVGEVLGVSVLDHVIIGDDDYSSLKQEGHI